MAGSKRTSNSQSKHNQEIKRLANEYKDKRYQVEADIQGFSQPPTVGGFRPDIKAKKGGQETIIEVETLDSVDSTRDVKQKDAFQDWASQDKKRHFKRKVV